VADVDESIGKGQELRRQEVSPAVRVVLAEAESPGALHYLLEAEGFQVVGCASNELELVRVLAQDIRPDVIVLDRDITVTSVSTAKEYAPAAQVIVIWPDGVQPVTGTRRVAPWLVYEDLGPAIRQALETPMLVETALAPTELASIAEVDPDIAVSADDDTAPRLARTAARTSVMSIVLIGAVLMTMGAVFAVGGMRVKDRDAAKRIVASQTAVRHASTTATTGNAGQLPDLPVKTPMACDHGPRWSSNRQAADIAPGAHDKRCPTDGGGTANKPDHAGQNQGHHGTGKPDDPGQSDGTHGQSGGTHGQSDGTHGQSGTSHGQSGQHGGAGSSEAPTPSPSVAPPSPGANGHGPNK